MDAERWRMPMHVEESHSCSPIQEGAPPAVGAGTQLPPAQPKAAAEIAGSAMAATSSLFAPAPPPLMAAPVPAATAALGDGGGAPAPPSSREYGRVALLKRDFGFIRRCGVPGDLFFHFSQLDPGSIKSEDVKASARTARAALFAGACTQCTHKARVPGAHRHARPSPRAAGLAAAGRRRRVHAAARPEWQAVGHGGAARAAWVGRV
jgi:hypothetical protein